MAARCDVCGRGPSTGFSVSHSHKKTKRRWRPNLHAMRIRVGGGVRRAKVCSSCLRANKVTKVV
jgi:large subunit ribosomal protein L28